MNRNTNSNWKLVTGIISLIFTIQLRSQPLIPVTELNGRIEVVFHERDSSSLYIGLKSGEKNPVGWYYGNTVVGQKAGRNLDDAWNNSFFGRSSGLNIRYGNDNSFFGSYSGTNSIGFGNSYFGFGTGRYVSSGSNNSYFGNQSGRYFRGSYNIAIGAFSGPNEDATIASRDSTLFIDVEEGESPLVYGEFNNDILRTNGTLQINNPSGKNSILRMQGNGGAYNEVIRYDSINNNVIMGSISGGGGKLLLRSNADTRMTIVENGDVGIGTTNPAHRLHVLGNGYFSNWLVVEDELFVNNVQAGSGTSDLRYNATTGRITSSTSDQRLKENIATIDHALDKILSLRGVSFTWKDMPEATPQLGLIAQEVMEVLPEVVNKNKNGYYGVDYSETIGVFVEAIKEQQNDIEELKSLLALTMAQVDELKLALLKKTIGNSE